MISPAQSRAGRALLNWSRERLAETSRVALRTIVDFEREAREPRILTKLAIKNALEAGGVVFVGGGVVLNPDLEPAIESEPGMPQQGM